MSDTPYSPPGVEIDENASPVPNIGQIVALPPARVALVGPSIGYRTFTETLTVPATDPVTLTQTGVDTTTIVVSSIGGTIYDLTDDYTVSETGVVPEAAVTTITRVAEGVIGVDEIVYVSYQYTDEAFYTPYLTSDWDEIQSRYGSALSVAGAITSPLSLAAKIVMEQGVRELILMPTKGSTPTSVTASQLSAAMVSIVSRSDVGIVVPLPVGITGTDGSPGETNQVGTDLRNHVANASADGNYRVGVLGLDKGSDRSHGSVAAAIGSARVMLAFPNAMNWYNGYTNTVIEVDGFYLAAAYAGRLASQSPQVPLTRKTVASFGSIPARILTLMTPTFKNGLSGNGVAVTEQLGDGTLSVRHGVSTDPSNTLTSEFSIIRAKDALLGMTSAGLNRSGLIGGPRTLTSPLDVRGIMEGVLTQAVSVGIIIAFHNLSVRVSPTDPTEIQIRFSYDPVFPLNRITVSFSINTQTGALAEAA